MMFSFLVEGCGCFLIRLKEVTYLKGAFIWRRVQVQTCQEIPVQSGNLLFPYPSQLIETFPEL